MVSFALGPLVPKSDGTHYKMLDNKFQRELVWRNFPSYCILIVPEKTTLKHLKDTS